FVPMSLYAVAFYTRDSEVNLLGVSWMAAMWVSVGLAQAAAACRGWMPERTRALSRALVLLVAVVLVASVPVRWTTISLRRDAEARTFLANVGAILATEPNAIIVSRSDAETFALWYGTWAAPQVTRLAAGTLPLNDALYQFGWYARLQEVRNPDLAGAGDSAQAVVAQNPDRPIYFAEPLEWAAGFLTPAPPLWRADPAAQLPTNAPPAP
ncbi:MAG: hypothetical protein ACRC1H_07835, partial [Caldilineaceae bacterium]